MLDDTAQAAELRRVLQRHPASYSKQAHYRCSFGFKCLHLREGTTFSPFARARPGWSKECFFLFLLLSQKGTPGISDAVHFLAFNFPNRHEAAILEHLQGGIDGAGAGRV